MQSVENNNNSRIAHSILPEWANERLRLDPWDLPHRVSVERTGSNWTIDRQGAVLKRQLGCGLPVSMSIPARAFKGVAARAIEQDDGSCRVTLELHHHDPDLCVPLLSALDLDDAAADWHAWSRLMQLPMLIVGADMVATPVRQRLGQIMVDGAFPRRKRWSLLKHRPWFLRRRKPGAIGPIVRISGEELFGTER